MNWREYSAAELQEISDSVGDRHGWDFSRMSTEREPVPWDFHEIAVSYLKPTDHVLDIGTGGGERLLELAAHYRSAIGVDPDPEMIQAATQNAQNFPRVSFQNMSAERLSLNDETVDAVLTRHAPTFVPELHRVMRPGGRFICQGIGVRNMENIRRAFGKGEETRYEDEYRQVILDLKTRGWNILVTGMYDANYWVKNPASLIFWFKAIAGANEVPEDFSPRGHAQVINHLIAQFATPRGLRTNEHRTLLVARKPEL